MPESSPARIAVVGGGWAGCAAAVTLARAGFPVTIIEQGRTLGGRARRIAVDGVDLDNGQHVLLGAYRQTLALIADVHPAVDVHRLFHRLPLTLKPFGPMRPGSFAFEAWNAPAPLHVAGGILGAKGLSWSERIALMAGYRRLAREHFRGASDESVARHFAAMPRRAFAAIWEPLCISALNTPPERASAEVFARVLRAALSGSARNSDLVIPAVDLSTCFPDAAAAFVVARGGDVRSGAAVRAIEQNHDAVTLKLGTDPERFAAAIVAVGPHQLSACVGAAAAALPAWRAPLARIEAFAYESITTIYLRFAGPVAFSAPMLRLDDAPGQWVFDRSHTSAPNAAREDTSLLAVVISAGGPHDALDQLTLAREVEAQLRRLEPALPPVVLSRVIAERRATYACTPGLARPEGGRVTHGVYLAGDYTDPEFPATLEAATRSGVAAAEALIADAAGAAARGSTRAP